MRLVLRFLSCFLLSLLICPSLYALGPENVLIVANARAEGSVEIAEYYAKRRGIDPARILQIQCEVKEEIDREHFNAAILKPIQNRLKVDKEVLALVPTRGVPLKIKASDDSSTIYKFRNMASVDSELTLARQPDYDIQGWASNPMFTKLDNLEYKHKVLAVCRLDGPSVDVAKAIVDKAIVAESLGCEGRCYLDLSKYGDKHKHNERNQHMERLVKIWTEMGLRFFVDDKTAVLDLSVQGEAVLHYSGWFTSSPSEWKQEVSFRTGAIASHVHYLSGATVRDPNRNWMAPLLNWGATAVYGVVYDSMLIGLPKEDILWKRLGAGFCYGEASLMASEALSWQSVFVGDPLYTPYREDWRAKKKEMRAEVAKRLKQDEPIDATKVATSEVERCAASILAMIERTKAAQSARGADKFAELAKFLLAIKDFDLNDMLETHFGDTKADAEKAFKKLKSDLKKEPQDTSEYERALQSWGGLPIYGELINFQNELGEWQTKEVEKLLKKAAKYAKKDKTYLKSWQEAANAARYKYSEMRKDALSHMKKMEDDHTDILRQQANEEIEPQLKKANKMVEKSQFDKARELLDEIIASYPACDQRAEASKLKGKIVAIENPVNLDE